PLHLDQGKRTGAYGARPGAGRYPSIQRALCGARRDQETACGPRAPLWPRGYGGRYFRQERAPGARRTQTDTRMINFETSPDRYNHWKLSYDGPVATLALDVAEDKGLAPGYKLKLNSYDLGVDIELHDAL